MITPKGTSNGTTFEVDGGELTPDELDDLRREAEEAYDAWMQDGMDGCLRELAGLVLQLDCVKSVTGGTRTWRDSGQVEAYIEADLVDGSDKDDLYQAIGGPFGDDIEYRDKMSIRPDRGRSMIQNVIFDIE